MIKKILLLLLITIVTPNVFDGCGLYNTEGDVNEDGVLNILDIVILTTLILVE